MTKHMSFKCWFADQTTQVVLENPSSTAANARIIFHLDQPSKITGTDRQFCSSVFAQKTRCFSGNFSCLSYEIDRFLVIHSLEV